jgi:phosphoribosylaminoimidazolecarboxamide formyltransferase/IMP cyclohydrolase
LDSDSKKIKKALISVFYKDGLLPLAQYLQSQGVEIFSTGGTRTFLEQEGFDISAIEDLTGYPSILGGRVKTLHPKVFGGILKRNDHLTDIAEMEQFDIPAFDLVIVDLYPFEETLTKSTVHQEIIEKIDIGGVSLIRAAAKNYTDVLILPDRKFYGLVLKALQENNGESKVSLRRKMAGEAFKITAAYDALIGSYIAEENAAQKTLRYGENPHQKATFKGDLSKVFSQIQGKEISYNNILDIDACLQLLSDFGTSACAIIKHNNACGFASDTIQLDAWNKALAGDPVSAFGGVIGLNRTIEKSTAEEINKIFFEIIIAPGYTDEALAILQSKKNRIILASKADFTFPNKLFRSSIGGILEQDYNGLVENPENWTVATTEKPSEKQLQDLLFAVKLVKHTKSNAIVLAGNEQLFASGTGQTSRVDALNQAIAKAQRNNFNLAEAVMASDAFFPFPDCVEIAAQAGIKAIAQPGGSIKDQDSIDKCNELGIAMVITGNRHFKH